ncbi:MAG: transcription elongation factor GreA [Clostridia bacterium]|nr:transcription elongation factor GreA [Clostridia bacterium]
MAEAYITLEGKKEKEERLQYLKSVVRPAVLEKLKTAREYGDLSENSEYDAARNEQGRLESEINMIEETLRTAKIVDTATLGNTEIHVGSAVKLYDMEFDEEVEYRIVGAIESDPDRGNISNESPIGKALVGKKVGEIATIVTPGGSIQMKVLEIL